MLVETRRGLAAKGDVPFAGHIADGHEEMYLDDTRYIIENKAELAKSYEADLRSRHGLRHRRLTEMRWVLIGRRTLAGRCRPLRFVP